MMDSQPLSDKSAQGQAAVVRLINFQMIHKIDNISSQHIDRIWTIGFITRSMPSCIVLQHSEIG